MLNRARRPGAGFSVIELMVTIALIGILMAIAIPTFGKWTADASARAVAESLTNAVRQTQSMAIARGRTSMFALTAANPPAVGSTPVDNGTNWFAALNPLGGPSGNSIETAASLGLILKSVEATQRAATIAGPALMCFNSLGRQSATLTAAQTSVATACSPAADDAHPTTYTVSRYGATRQFNVQVFPGGRVRMCDAAKAISSSNPDGC